MKTTHRKVFWRRASWPYFLWRRESRSDLFWRCMSMGFFVASYVKRWRVWGRVWKRFNLASYVEGGGQFFVGFIRQGPTFCGVIRRVMGTPSPLPLSFTCEWCKRGGFPTEGHHFRNSANIFAYFQDSAKIVAYFNDLIKINLCWTFEFPQSALGLPLVPRDPGSQDHDFSRLWLGNGETREWAPQSWSATQPLPLMTHVQFCFRKNKRMLKGTEG